MFWKRKLPYELPHGYVLTVRRSKRDRSMRIDIVFYKDVIKRYLRITSEALRQKLKMPRTTELPPLNHHNGLDRLILEAKQELNRVGSQLPPRQATTRIGKARDTVSVPPFGAVETARPKAARQPVEITGTLVESGVGERALHGKTIRQFYVEVRVNDLNGQVQRFWGEDLRRALKEAGAKPGDEILLGQCGTVPCIVPHEALDAQGNVQKTTMAAFKNAFVVTLLNQKSEARHHVTTGR